MGKKYIVEIGRLERLYKAFVGAHGKPEITWLSPEVDLTPYTEPDLEQVRKEAYEQGYENGFVAGHLKAEKSGQSFYEDGYQRGLNDAWDTMRKIRGMTWNKQREVFGTDYFTDIIALPASKCIEKIRQYEQAQEEIKIGDEVTAEHGGSTFTVTWMSDRCICGIDSDGRCYSYELNEVDGKTGNHHEIVAVLEKMRGEQDG